MSASQTPAVNDIYQYNELHLDSAARDGGSNNAPSFIVQPAYTNVLGVKLVSAQIPFTYHVFNPRNDSFLLLLDPETPTDTRTVTLAHGNYTIDTFGQALGQALGTAAAGATTFAVDVDPTTQRFVVMADSGQPFALQFGDERDIGESNPRMWIGFGPGIARSTENGILTAPHATNVTGPNYLYLISTVAGRLTRSIRINGGSTIDPVALAKIPVTVNPWGMILFTDPTPNYAFDMSLGQIQQIQLSLQFGHTEYEVDMNGSPWSVVLQVLTQRDTSFARDSATASSGNKRIRVA